MYICICHWLIAILETFQIPLFKHTPLPLHSDKITKPIVLYWSHNSIQSTANIQMLQGSEIKIVEWLTLTLKDPTEPLLKQKRF